MLDFYLGEGLFRYRRWFFGGRLTLFAVATFRELFLYQSTAFAEMLHDFAKYMTHFDDFGEICPVWTKSKWKVSKHVIFTHQTDRHVNNPSKPHYVERSMQTETFLAFIPVHMRGPEHDSTFTNKHISNIMPWCQRNAYYLLVISILCVRTMEMIGQVCEKNVWNVILYVY